MVTEKERALMDLRDVFEYAFDEIFVTDEQGIVVRVNSTCERHYQLPAEKLIGRHVKDLQKEGIFIHLRHWKLLRSRSRLNLFKQQNQENICMSVQDQCLMNKETCDESLAIHVI